MNVEGWKDFFTAAAGAASALAGLVFVVARNLGFGVAVDAFDVDISADVDDWKGGVH